MTRSRNDGKIKGKIFNCIEYRANVTRLVFFFLVEYLKLNSSICKFDLHYAPNWASPIPWLVVFLDAYAIKP